VARTSANQEWALDFRSGVLAIDPGAERCGVYTRSVWPWKWIRADFWPRMIEEPVAKPESGSEAEIWSGIRLAKPRAEGGLVLKTSGRARQPLPARSASRSGTAGRLHFRPQ
jgi:hypothetical protein